jgi:hypothetical protein
MTRTVHGVIHGRSIEFAEDLGIADGQEVETTVKTVPTSPPKPWGEGLRRCAGAFAADWTEEDDRILELLYQERKGSNGSGRSQREART